MICLTAVAGLILLSPVFAQDPGELVYTAISPFEREATISAHRDMVNTLSNALGREIQIVYEVDHHSVITAFIDGEIDIAYLGSLPLAVLARRYDNFDILAAVNEDDGLPFYRCALVRAFDGPATVAELQGQIALTNPLSTCGYLSVSSLLAKHDLNIEDYRYSFIGTHDDVALAVIRGDYAAGGVKDAVARRFAGLLLEVLDYTDDLPGHVVVANRVNLTEDEVIALRTSLTHVTYQQYKSWGVGSTGFSYMDAASYESLAELMDPSFEWLFMESMP